ncbi:MAG: nucleotidyltransferase domain-containing protein [Acidobacteriota bacterium]
MSKAPVDGVPDVIDALVDVLRDRPVAPGRWARLEPASFWAAAESHGVLPLVADVLRTSANVPEAFRRTAIEAARPLVAAALVREVALRELIAALEGAGITALVFKGAWLAYAHYRRPDLRPRLDTDVLVHPAQRRATHALLVSMGYTPDVLASTGLVMHQRAYARRVQGGLPDVVDLHWRLTNPEVFGHALSFEELLAESRCVPSLGLRGFGNVHTLLVACVHRAAHHPGDERLMWLYDVDLLARALDDQDWRRVVDLAVERRIWTVCDATLRRCIDVFGTRIPVDVWSEAGARSKATTEPTAAYVTRRRSRLHAVVDDVRALPTWGERYRLLRDYAFPPVDYMREVYAPASTMPLPYLYARRMVLGARRWLDSR